MLKRKSLLKTICLIIVSAVLLTSCNKPTSNTGTGSPGDASQKGASGSDVKKTGTMGRYVQKDVSPAADVTARPNQFIRSSTGKILLSASNRETEKEEIFAYTYKAEKWTPQDTKAATALIADKKGKFVKLYQDYQSNQWVSFVGEGKKLHLFKIAPDGTASEISIPLFKEASSTSDNISFSDLRPNEDGTVCITVSLMGKTSSIWMIIDGKTGKITQTITPLNADYNPVLIGNELYTSDIATRKMNVYDIATGKISSSFSIELLGDDLMPSYNIDNKGQLVYVNADGIHQLVLGGSVPQTVIDSDSFAYASPLASALMVAPSGDDTFFMTCTENGKLKVYNYAIDTSLPTALDESITVWALDDSQTVRAAASAFATQYTNCDIKLEFGKQRESTAVNDADIIKNLNTRLAAGETPDVLFLDGLSINTMISGGMLTELDGIVSEADYYKNILNCYKNDGKTYAYPTTFIMPVLLSSGDKVDFDKATTLAAVAEIYKDKKLIFNNSYQDVFDAFYPSISHLIFPDGKSIDEGILRDFLTQTKSIMTSQNITEENPSGVIATSGGSLGSVSKPVAVSLDNFQWGGYDCGTGLVDTVSHTSLFFVEHKDVKINPLPGSGFVPMYVSSIPQDAANKDMAKNFIKVLLTDPIVQGDSSFGGFPIKRGIAEEKVAERLEQLKGDGNQGGNLDFKGDPLAFDWDSVVAKYKAPANTEAYLKATVYEQAVKLYTNTADVEAATKEILKKTKLYFAERQ